MKSQVTPNSQNQPWKRTKLGGSHSITMCFWCFEIWGLADSGEIVLPRARLFLDTVNDPPVSVPFINNPEPKCQSTFFIGLSYYGLLSTCLNYPGPGTRQLETAARPQSLLKLFQLAHPEPAYYPASHVPSWGNYNKNSCPCFPLWLCLPTNPDAPPYGPEWNGMPPPLGNCEEQTIFPWIIPWSAALTLSE